MPTLSQPSGRAEPLVPLRQERLETAITACITTYRRPAALARLVRSIERFQPRLTILVQHTGSNLSWGRNRLARACPTPFYLMLEDDFEFTAETDLGALLEILANDGELAAVGGTVVEQGRRRSWCHTFDLFRGDAALLPSALPWRVSRSGAAYRPCHAILNFGLFRKAALLDIPWDEALPLSEHRDWYFRLWRDARWRVAHTPCCEVLHHRDRPGEYCRDRGRSFLDRVRRKHGLRFLAPAGSGDAHDRPDVLVLAVGHANTTLTARQLAALGWNLGDADGEFAESVAVREINRRLLARESFDQRAAATALARLPRPWALKDPRFAETLPHWLAALRRYRPLLLWVTKDRAAVEASYVRRGTSADRAAAIVAAREASCRRHFQRWPWTKLQLDAAQVRSAALLFDPER